MKKRGYCADCAKRKLIKRDNRCKKCYDKVRKEQKAEEARINKTRREFYFTG
ncbi:hypothetical protein LCGC14_0341350 [marine sediment metagenome]|uniref:Uncharacterized protein n=1 Tax=marine sediment metagenome TaxID=412755 RepID=A0A0F9WLB9_9ZZZZ